MIKESIINAIGLSGEKVNRLLGKINNYNGISLTVTENHSITTIKVTAEGETEKDAALNALNVTERIKTALGQNVFDNSEHSIQGRVVKLLKSHKLKLATAESCTSGIISSKITDINGASEVFDFGISAYSNEIKMNALNVSPKLLETYGAVSSQTAAGMAIGAMRISGADIGLSVTGVAGPDKSEGKPVGLIYIGMCDKYGLWVLKLNLFDKAFNREEIRERTAELALDFVRRYLEFTNFGAPLYRGGDQYAILQEKLTDFSVSHEFEDLSTETKIPQKEIEKTEQNDSDSQQIESEKEIVDEIIDNEVFEQTEETLIEETADSVKEEYLTDESVSTSNIFEDTVINQSKKNENTNIKKPILRKFLPWIGDSVGELIRKVSLLTVCAVAIIFTVYLANNFISINNDKETLKNVTAVYNFALSNENANQLNQNGIMNKFQELYNDNNDVFGWLNAAGGEIYAPVLKSDFDYSYSYKNFYKEPSKSGSLFLNADFSSEKGEQNRNTVIFGNNIQGESVFSNLLKYTEVSYLKENHTLTFDTLYQNKKYVIFAVIKTDTYSSFANTKFENEDEFGTFLNKISKSSLFNISVDVNSSDNILTLITQSNDGGDERVMIMAKEISDSESYSYNVSVNTQK